MPIDEIEHEQAIAQAIKKVRAELQRLGDPATTKEVDNLIGCFVEYKVFLMDALDTAISEQDAEDEPEDEDEEADD